MPFSYLIALTTMLNGSGEMQFCLVLHLRSVCGRMYFLYNACCPPPPFCNVIVIPIFFHSQDTARLFMVNNPFNMQQGLNFLIFYFCFETRFLLVAQASLEFEVFQPQPYKGWDYRCEPPGPVLFVVLLRAFMMM